MLEHLFQIVNAQKTHHRPVMELDVRDWNIPLVVTNALVGDTRAEQINHPGPKQNKSQRRNSQK